MPVGFAGVVDRVNTTTGTAINVIALYGVGGLGVTEGSGVVPPPPGSRYNLITEGGDFIDTEDLIRLITQQTVPVPLVGNMSTQAGDLIATQDNDLLYIQNP